jgi:putative copper resistance protein D
MLELAIAAARFAQFLSAAVLFGAPAFLLYAVGSGREDWRWAKPLLIASAVLLAGATVAGFFAQTINMSGSLDDALSPETLTYVLFRSSSSACSAPWRWAVSPGAGMALATTAGPALCT